MRFFCPLAILFCCCVFPAFPQNYIDIDLTSKEIKLDKFYFGGVPVTGKLSFSHAQGQDYLSVEFKGEDIIVGEKRLAWFKAKLVKDQELLSLRHVRSPDFFIQGTIDFNKEEVSLNINIDSYEQTPSVSGRVKAQVHVWGKMYNVSASGYLTIENGVCQGTPVERAYFNFIGNPPMLNLTDSELLLKDGSIYKLQGMIDLRNQDNILPNARFTSRKVQLDGWQLLSEGQAKGSSKAAGVKKGIDESLDVLFNTYEKNDIDETYVANTNDDTDPTNTGAELRYKFTNDQFLKLRMQQDKTIIGFEHRKEF